RSHRAIRKFGRTQEVEGPPTQRVSIVSAHGLRCPFARRRPTIYCSLFGEYLFRLAVSSAAATGDLFVPPITICLFVTPAPYNSVLVSLSGRSVAPFKAMPAKTPRALE